MGRASCCFMASDLRPELGVNASPEGALSDGHGWGGVRVRPQHSCVTLGKSPPLPGLSSLLCRVGINAPPSIVHSSDTHDRRSLPWPRWAPSLHVPWPGPREGGPEAADRGSKHFWRWLQGGFPASGGDSGTPGPVTVSLTLGNHHTCTCFSALKTP